MLFDERYQYASNKSQISKWLRDKIKVSDSYASTDLQTRAFFQKMKSMNFQPKVKQLEELKVAFDDANEGEVLP